MPRKKDETIPIPLKTKHVETPIVVNAKVPASVLDAPPPPEVFATPTSTQEESKVVEAQRETSRMWETTQMKIAIWAVIGGFVVNALVTTVMLVVVLAKISVGESVSSLEFAILMTVLGNISGTSGIIIGFYFSRTNHTKVGGPGYKPPGETR